MPSTREYRRGEESDKENMLGLSDNNKSKAKKKKGCVVHKRKIKVTDLEIS